MRHEPHLQHLVGLIKHQVCDPGMGEGWEWTTHSKECARQGGPQASRSELTCTRRGSLGFLEYAFKTSCLGIAHGKTEWVWQGGSSRYLGTMVWVTQAAAPAFTLWAVSLTTSTSTSTSISTSTSTSRGHDEHGPDVRTLVGWTGLNCHSEHLAVWFVPPLQHVAVQLPKTLVRKVA